MNKIELGELKDYYYRNYDFDSLLDLLFDEEDKVEKFQDEIERLNNIINELKEWLNEDVKVRPDLHFQVLRKVDILDKIKELEENK